MNRNMEDTRKWYIEHDMHAEFVKKYICTKCRDFTYKSVREPAKWDVSYNRVPAYGVLTQAQRIRREG